MQHPKNGPTTRLRVFGWLDPIRALAVVSSYLAHRMSSPSYVARRHVAVPAGKRRQLRTVSDPPRCLLLDKEASLLSQGEPERLLLSSPEPRVYDFDDLLQRARAAPTRPENHDSLRGWDGIAAEHRFCTAIAYAGSRTYWASMQLRLHWRAP